MTDTDKIKIQLAIDLITDTNEYDVRRYDLDFSITRAVSHLRDAVSGVEFV